MKRLVIEEKTAVKNQTAARERLGGAEIRALVSYDGFGAGLMETARTLAAHGGTKFAVFDGKEGEKLRKNGFVEEEILLLRSTTDKNELERAMDLNLVALIGTSEAGMALNSLAEQRSTVAEAMLWLDCGAGDGGFPAEEHDKILNAFQSLQNVAISGIFTHLPKNSAGEKALNEALEFLRKSGVETGRICGRGESRLLDEVVLGEELLRGAVRCEASVEEIRWLGKGQTLVVGGRVKKLRKAAKLATIPVGYLDGLPEKIGLFRPKATARIGDKRLKIRAVFAASALVDATEARCKIGDIAQVELDPLRVAGMEREYRP